MFLLCVSLFGQGSAGSIAGTVTDQSGGALAGAMVTVTDVDRGINRTLTTDASGAYSAPNLTPGNYKVRAEFKGFKTVERQNIQLEVERELRVDLSLAPGEQTQVVNVTEAIPLIETTNAELGGTLQNQVINDLPLNGRNFENLLDLRPASPSTRATPAGRRPPTASGPMTTFSWWTASIATIRGWRRA